MSLNVIGLFQSDRSYFGTINIPFFLSVIPRQVVITVKISHSISHQFLHDLYRLHNPLIEEYVVLRIEHLVQGHSLT